MPPWLQAALVLLGSGIAQEVGAQVGRTGRDLVQHFQTAGTGMLPSLPGLSGFGGSQELPGIHIDAFGRVIKRRRRRRRALTASDRADIAFIAGILGKVAGKEIAAIIAARTG